MQTTEQLSAPGPIPVSEDDARVLLNKLLLNACSKGDGEKADALLQQGAQAHYQEEGTGMSVLMMASLNGHKEIVKTLLDCGAPWNALDRAGKCAGEYAVEGFHQEIIDMLVTAGVQAELVLGSLENKLIERYGTQDDPSCENNYLSNSVAYEITGKESSADGLATSGRNLMEKETQQAVMMQWEKPLMDIHANLLTSRVEEQSAALSSSEIEQKEARLSHIRVLNIGFGLGLFDTELQRINEEYKSHPSNKAKENMIEKHCIIEAHPTVLAEMRRQGWDNKENVVIFEGKWQDVLQREEFKKVGKFDGIFFDTYGEYYRDMQILQAQLPSIMRPKGIYSFFNGLCPRNIFFHGVCCEIVKLELTRLQFEVNFHPLSIESLNKLNREKSQVDDVTDEKTWKGVKDKYWFSDTYYLPFCVYEPSPAQS